jgi:hypothetical protein
MNSLILSLGRLLSRTALCAALVTSVLTTGLSARAQDFNLNRDLSVTSNPGGVWTLGWKETLTGSLVPVTFVAKGAADNGVPFYCWSIQQFVLPGFYYYPLTNTATAINAGGQGVHPPGTIMYLAGETAPQNFAVIRFTAPSNGQYRVAVSVRHYLDGNGAGDTEFHVHHNGQSLLSQFLTPVETTGYTNTLTLAAGDTVDFADGRGADGSLFGSGLEIGAVITPLTTPVLPFITQHPDSITEKTGDRTKFKVVASSPTPVQYQWFFEGEELPGQTASTLVIRPVRPKDAGTYSVRVTNAAGSVWAAAVLTVRRGNSGRTD